MKSLLNDFLKLFANCMLIICFIMVAFLLVVNIYHYKELSYVYYKDMNESLTYTNYVNKKNDIKNKIDSLNDSEVGGKIKQLYTDCYNSIEDSSFNKFKDKNNFILKDAYDANAEMKDELSNKCFFLVSYSVKNMKEKGKITEDLTEIDNYVSTHRDMIISNNSFLFNHLLSNSIYTFVTDVTRNSIYNNTAETINQTIQNYYVFVDTVDYSLNWYLNNLGGVR